MPKILERCVRQLTPKHGKSSAYGICTKSMQKAGNMKGSKATAKGKKRGEMTPGERAKDRASKYSGKRKSSDYKYNKKTNRATIR